MDRWLVEGEKSNSSPHSTGNSFAAPSGLCKKAAEYCVPKDGDDELQIIASKGYEHEKAFLQKLQVDGRQVIEIKSKNDSVAATMAAMQDGAKVIHQAHLLHGQFGGHADFLFRVDGPSAFETIATRCGMQNLLALPNLTLLCSSACIQIFWSKSKAAVPRRSA
ncbi:MAG: hypothetical protein R3C03_23365 [Pirellulaceae bacterium]